MMGVMGEVALGPAISGAAWTVAARLKPKKVQRAILQATVLMRSSFLVSGVHHSKEGFA
jgi:cytochrome c-type biogenesis protein CcmH/NrfG